MSFENSAGLGTYNHYGPRVSNVEDGGNIKTEGIVNELTFDVTGEFINDVIAGGTSRSLSIMKLPAGAKILSAIVDVTTVFVASGTTPTVRVGTEGSEASNNFAISEAQLEALGTYEITSFNGTWAAKLTADTQIGFSMGGSSSPAVTDAGAARIVIRYVKVQ